MGMESFMEFLTWEKLSSIGLFIAKPLVILIVCKFIIGALLKLADGVMVKTKLDAGIQSFAKSALKIGLWVLTLIFVADSLGVNTASLVALLSVASLALSLSVQGLFTNVFSGITILLTKPFVVGDYVEVAGIAGTVREIKLMRTTLTTPDNKVELIPNGDIAAQNIINYSTEPMRRVDIKVSASYDAPTETVYTAIKEVLNTDTRVKQDEGKEPFVRLSAYNSNDIEYTIRVWVDNANYWGVYFDTLENIRTSFAKHGVEFSYPHTMVHMVEDKKKGFSLGKKD